MVLVSPKFVTSPPRELEISVLHPPALNSGKFLICVNCRRLPSTRNVNLFFCADLIPSQPRRHLFPPSWECLRHRSRSFSLHNQGNVCQLPSIWLRFTLIWLSLTSVRLQDVNVHGTAKNVVTCRSCHASGKSDAHNTSLGHVPVASPTFPGQRQSQRISLLLMIRCPFRVWQATDNLDERYIF